MKDNLKYIFLITLVSVGCSSSELPVSLDSEYPLVSTTSDQCIDPNFDISIDPSIAARCNVNSIVVQNCLGYSSCFRSYYQLNQCGKVTESVSPMGTNFTKYQYGQDCELIGMTRVNWHQDNYTYFEGDSVYVEISGLEGALIDTNQYQMKFKLVCENKRGNYNDDGQLITDTLGPLMYPCGTDLPGSHIAHYHYYKNGLVKYVEIFDSIDQIEVELEYFYYENDSIPLDFEINYGDI